MKNTICDLLHHEFPVLAFSHCRDVVAAVTNTGGFGVLGVTGLLPDRLEEELAWIDHHVQGKPYGVDLVVPEEVEGKGEHLNLELLVERIPTTHRQFVRELLASHGLGWDESLLREQAAVTQVFTENAEKLLDVALRHPIKLVANALGVPPQFMLERAKAAGIPVAALVGSTVHARKQLAAGVDLLVAQGYEAGGHTGEIATMVLVPEVVEAVQGRVPVLAAGGIATGRQLAAALALGAAGAWTGSVWLTTQEAETPAATKEKMLAASSSDTQRSRSRTGKPARQLVSDWTKAWEGPQSPGALPMPLQPILSQSAFSVIDAAAQGGDAGATALASYFVGQAVGLMNKPQSVREVMFSMMEDFLSTTNRIAELQAASAEREGAA